MLAKLFILCIKGYRYAISPLLPCSCRFLPTCSEYAVEACQRHGALRGLGLTIKRVLRCHPLGGHGLDPVPAPVVINNKKGNDS